MFKPTGSLLDYYHAHSGHVMVLSDAQFNTIQADISDLSGRVFGPPDQPNMPVLRYRVVVPTALINGTKIVLNEK